jgi:FkbM family methyltransferase
MVLNPNRHNFVFNEPSFLENFVLNEIEKDYRFDEMGLKPGDLVLDIGACTGVVSMYIAKLFNCRILAYEPAPRNYDLLVKNIASNNLGHLVRVFNLALTKDGRDVRIGNNPVNWGGNNIYGEGDTIHSTTLKDIIKEPVRLLKIDAERAEFEILEDLEPLKMVQSLRGEFHGHKTGDIETLLEHVKKVIPDAKPIMHKSWALRTREAEEMRKRMKK